MAAGAVRIRGLKELQRDFRKMSKDLAKEVREELKTAGEPVAERAQELALSEIRNMPRSPDWAGMRVRATARSVYVVPQRRRRGGSGRSNLADLMMDRAMDPALDQRQDEVVEALDKMLGRMAGENGF